MRKQVNSSLARRTNVFVAIFALAFALIQTSARSQPLKADDDLADFVTLDKAAHISATKQSAAKRTGAGYLGVNVDNVMGALTVSQIQADSPAASAGLLPGDVLLKLDGSAIYSATRLRELVQAVRPDSKATITYRRAEAVNDVQVTLAATSRPLSAAPVGSGGGVTKGKGAGQPKAGVKLSYFTKEVFKLVVVPIDFADFKHSDKIPSQSWEDAIFSTGSYNDTNATGQRVFGSLNDYFREQSYGKFKIEGQVAPAVALAKKRADYVVGNGTANKTAVLVDALAKLEAGEAKEALKTCDGVCFIYSGARMMGNAGSVYYPHQGSVIYQNKRLPYILVPEGGKTMDNISTFAKPFAEMLGLPDLAATPDPGSVGLGVWCLLSNGAGQTGKPGHMSAWCKEQLGWLDPTVIDPAVKQKLIVSPVASSPHECLKILARTDGSEYFLLENRVAKGFDAALPGEGLLIWRVINGRPILEGSHGVSGPSGPKVYLDSVPYPSKANNSFTAITTPSSRSLVGGGQPIHVTNIRRLPDGRITLAVGYEYY